MVSLLSFNQNLELINLQIELLYLLISSIDLLLQAHRLLLERVYLLSLALIFLLKESPKLIRSLVLEQDVL